MRGSSLNECAAEWVGRGVRGIRNLGVALAAGGSILAAGGMLWVLVRPEVLGQVQTGVLLTVVALIALPVIAVGAWLADRGVCRERRLAARIERELAERCEALDQLKPDLEPASLRHDETDLRTNLQTELEALAGELTRDTSGRAPVAPRPASRDRSHRRRRRPDALPR